MTSKDKNAFKSQYVHEVQVQQVRRLLKAYLHTLLEIWLFMAVIKLSLKIPKPPLKAINGVNTAKLKTAVIAGVGKT